MQNIITLEAGSPLPPLSFGQGWQDNKMFVMRKVDNKRTGVDTSWQGQLKVYLHFKNLFSITEGGFYREDK